MDNKEKSDLAAELARNARVIQALNSIYREIHNLMKEKSHQLEGKLFRTYGREVQYDEIYARVKLLVAYRMMAECHEWTLENYEVRGND